ncbi:hypothetical protein EYR38_007426 [Pleurotus pulmonarius]|nr:hypothetical protein EYR38_007426 [Pleurotus pulmonarius]
MSHLPRRPSPPCSPDVLPSTSLSSPPAAIPHPISILPYPTTLPAFLHSRAQTEETSCLDTHRVSRMGIWTRPTKLVWSQRPNERRTRVPTSFAAAIWRWGNTGIRDGGESFESIALRTPTHLRAFDPLVHVFVPGMHLLRRPSPPTVSLDPHPTTPLAYPHSRITDPSAAQTEET